MHKIAEITPLDGYKLNVLFVDGMNGIVDLSAELTGPIFGPLADETLFRTVSLDAFGVPAWQNGADIAPDALYEEISAASR
jgi:hypothetical protein